MRTKVIRETEIQTGLFTSVILLFIIEFPYWKPRGSKRALGTSQGKGREERGKEVTK